MATKATELDETDAAPEQQTDGPLLDLTDASVKRMVKLAKKRGYVTYEEVHEVLPEGQSDPDQLEDVLSQLPELGINALPAEETAEAAVEKDAEGAEGARGTAVWRAAPAA